MGGVTARIRVRGGADDNRLVDLHDWSLDGVGERACGGGAHVHHHAALSGWDLFAVGEEEEGREVDEEVGNK